MSYQFRMGTAPILISIPHHGSKIPEELAEQMTADGRTSRDTDWFLERLYDLEETREASWLVAEYSRYVIDLNRPSSNESLYPGQTTTGLIPETCFDGSPIYSGAIPDANERDRRVRLYWQPYHQELQRELDRLVSQHGIAVLIEAHSIASVVPRLFDGVLPDFNLGTSRGESCGRELEQEIVSVLDGQPNFTYVVNGRFIGGYITRHFGKPDHGVHAIQIELSQATYLDETTLVWDDTRATRVQPVFRKIFSVVKQWIQQQT